jgi:hypothetical protein
MILVLLCIILRLQFFDMGQEDNLYKSAVSINVSNVGVRNFVKLFTAATHYTCKLTETYDTCGRSLAGRILFRSLPIKLTEIPTYLHGTVSKLMS